MLMLKMERIRYFLKRLMLLAVAGLTLGYGVALAATPAPGGAIAQSFTASSDKGEVVAGALVSVQPNNPRTVELATSDSAAQLAGVAAANPLVVIGGGIATAQVVLSGTTTVLVSDINGPIKVGDKITTSPIAGVGMLATSDTRIAGTAQTALDTHAAQARSVPDSSGHARTVHIGVVTLQVGVAAYQAPTSQFLPPFLQSLANAVAGRSVSLARVLICSLLLLFSFLSIAVLIYTAVRSAIISIGRNPLAAKAIRRGLYQVTLVALVILSAALLASYLILTL